MPLRARRKGGFDWSRPRRLWVIRQMSDEVHGYCFEYIMRWWGGRLCWASMPRPPRLFLRAKERRGKKDESRKGFVLCSSPSSQHSLYSGARGTKQPRFRSSDFQIASRFQSDSRFRIARCVPRGTRPELRMDPSAAILALLLTNRCC